MNKSKNGRRILYLSKIKKRKRFKKQSRIKKAKFYQNKKVIKFFYIFILFIFYTLFTKYMPRSSHDISEKENDSHYDWEENDSHDDWEENVKKMINKYISIINGTECNTLYEDINKANFYLNLPEYKENNNSAYNIEIKENYIKYLSKKYGKDFRKIKIVVTLGAINFGNTMVALSNIIYYCEVLGIKNLYLNSKNNFFIKNDIISDKINISIKSIDKLNCFSQDIFCGHIHFDFFYPQGLRPKRRISILKKEIMNNLPKVQINKNDLYIYIRSGDIFISSIEYNYTPSPYCFYERIIKSFKFNDIYIISVDDKNPVIGKLISNFPYIKHKLNDIKLDISILANAYNLANSISSFSQTAISLNDNLENLFEYEIYKIYAAIIHYHYDIYKLNRRFNVYRMKPTQNYFKKMHKWSHSEEQMKLLLDENCTNELIKTKY